MEGSLAGRSDANDSTVQDSNWVPGRAETPGRKSCRFCNLGNAASRLPCALCLLLDSTGRWGFKWNVFWPLLVDDRQWGARIRRLVCIPAMSSGGGYVPFFEKARECAIHNGLGAMSPLSGNCPGVLPNLRFLQG